MKRFFLLNLFLIMAAAVIAPSAIANSQSRSTATDLNGDGVISIQELRLHSLDYRNKK